MSAFYNILFINAVIALTGGYITLTSGSIEKKGKEYYLLCIGLFLTAGIAFTEYILPDISNLYPMRISILAVILILFMFGRKKASGALLIAGLSVLTGYLPALLVVLTIGVAVYFTFKHLKYAFLLFASISLIVPWLTSETGTILIPIAEISALIFIILYELIDSRGNYEKEIGHYLTILTPVVLIGCFFVFLPAINLSVRINRFYLSGGTFLIISAASGIAYLLKNRWAGGLHELLERSLKLTSEISGSEFTLKKKPLPEKIKHSHEALISALKHNREELTEKTAKIRNLDELKEEFIRNISHELKTSMTVIIGNLKMCKTEDKETSKKIKASLVKAKELLERIEDILNYSKLKAGKLVPSLSEFNLADLLHSVIKEWNSEKNLELIKDIHSLEVIGDQTMTARATRQILKNAEKYSPDNGEINIITRIARDIDDSDMASVEIKDQGEGIPLELKDTIFEEFKQGDGSANREHGGTGLGLTYARKLMRVQDGNIELKSSSAQSGTTFRLLLPLSKKD